MIKNVYPPKEKILVLIHELLFSSNGMDKIEIAKLLQCSKRTATRIISLIRDMSHELPEFQIDIEKGKPWSGNSKLNITLKLRK